MERVRLLEHGGKTIVLLDFSHMSPCPEFQDLLKTAKKMIQNHPVGTALTLTDISDSHFDPEVLNTFKDFTKKNKPYVKASAVVGVSGLRELALNVISRFSSREFRTFDNRDKAIEWLAVQ